MHSYLSSLSCSLHACYCHKVLSEQLIFLLIAYIVFLVNIFNTKDNSGDYLH